MVSDESLTVVLWLWKGWRPVYNYRHVNAMVRMLRDHLTIPHYVVCITDNPEGLECETYPLWNDPVRVKGVHFNVAENPRRRNFVQPNSYMRLAMFSAEAADVFPGRVLSLDLDCVINKNMDHLITPDDFRINKGVSSPYNGGMWLLRTGTRTRVWDKFDARAYEITQRAGYKGSDQAWISFALGSREKTWDAKDGVHHYTTTKHQVPANCVMFFCAGKIKPWDVEFQQKHPHLAMQYNRYLNDR